jgi:hypothetical protein
MPRFGGLGAAFGRIGGGGKVPASSTPAAAVVAITSVAHAVSGTDAASYTFSAQTLGVGKIVVGATARRVAGASSFTGCTINGVAADQIVQLGNAGVTNHAALYIADCTVATGDVVVTFDQTMLRCGIGIWLMTGAASSVASDSDSSTAEPGAVTLTVPANGGAIGVACCTSGTSTTWTGLTENYDEEVEGASAFFQSGASTTSAGGGNIAMQSDWSAAPSNPMTVFASWGP